MIVSTLTTAIIVNMEKKWIKKLVGFVGISLVLVACVVKDKNPLQKEMVEDKNSLAESETYTVAIQSGYRMQYSDNSRTVFESDGIFERGKEYTYLKNNIYANGVESTIEGYYDGSRLYNNYNGVSYYEDMTFQKLQESMLVKFDFLKPKPDEIESKHDGVLVLKKESAKKYFLEHYDFYGLDQYEKIEIKENKIEQLFDQKGRKKSEIVDYKIIVEVQDQKVNIAFHSAVNYLKYQQTEVVVSKELQNKWQSYVSFQNIDTSKISDANIESDAREDTALATFQKRLRNRLHYQVNAYGWYESKFNDMESYVIDFQNNTFIYRNRTSEYVYNWREDFGGFGSSCNFNFVTDTASSKCRESVLETIKQVKLYFEMELYYCGLSIDEL